MWGIAYNFILRDFRIKGWWSRDGKMTEEDAKGLAAIMCQSYGEDTHWAEFRE